MPEAYRRIRSFEDVPKDEVDLIIDETGYVRISPDELDITRDRLFVNGAEIVESSLNIDTIYARIAAEFGLSIPPEVTAQLGFESFKWLLIEEQGPNDYKGPNDYNKGHTNTVYAAFDQSSKRAEVPNDALGFVNLRRVTWGQWRKEPTIQLISVGLSGIVHDLTGRDKRVLTYEYLQTGTALAMLSISDDELPDPAHRGYVAGGGTFVPIPTPNRNIVYDGAIVSEAMVKKTNGHRKMLQLAAFPNGSGFYDVRFLTLPGLLRNTFSLATPDPARGQNNHALVVETRGVRWQISLHLPHHR